MNKKQQLATIVMHKGNWKKLTFWIPGMSTGWIPANP